MKNRSFFASLLLIFMFLNLKSTSSEFLEIENEIEKLQPKYEWGKVEINNTNAPTLSSLINKYLQKFCAKTDTISPKVCLYYNSKYYENYNNYWNGKNILIGSEIVKILLYKKDFEKYFEALFAHEFAHFKLNHKPANIFAQEEAADKLAFTLIDNPKNLVYAHLLSTLISLMVEILEYNFSEPKKLNNLISQTIDSFISLSPDFGTYTKCSSWIAFDHLFFEAFIKTNFNNNLDTFATEFAFNLAQVGDKSHSKLNMDNLKIWTARFMEFLRHPFAQDTHPSPQQLSTWCRI